MEFKTKKFIAKFRRYTSIFMAIILLATAFSLRILANRGGIMKNIVMADSKDVIEKVEDETNNLQTGENNEIEINQKESDLFEDNKNVIENNSFQPNSDVFYTLTSGENINYIDYKNNILNFSMIINEDSKSIEKENKLYESEENGELNLNKNTVYKQILTSDAIGVYSTKYTKLPDDSYSFTKVTIPGKDNFSFSNEKKPLNGKYTIKIMTLNKGKTRKFKSYETIYEGEWKNEEITKKIDNIKAIRVEISGLEEKINDFNITIEGNADISGYLSTNSNTVFNNQDEYKICYVISESFSESFDKDGNELTKSITDLNYLKSDLYSEDYNNYGKGLLRSFNNLKIQEQLNHVVILAKHDLNNDKLLENAKYGLFADTKLSINDKIFMPGELIESKVTNEMGEIEFKIYGFLNNFYIKEIAPPSGYCSSDYLFYLKNAQQIVDSKDGIKIIGKVDDKNIIRINAYDEKKESNNSIESDSNDTKQNEEGLANQNNILDNDNQKNSNNGKDGNENKSTDLGKNASENKNKSVDKDNVIIENKELKINKIINANDIIKSHGDICFIFKIVGKNTKELEKITLYRTITFSEEDIKNVDSNGDIKKSVVISNLPENNYEITQEINSRFILNSIIPVENASVNGNIGEANLQKNIKAEITFKSNKNKNSLLSDCKLIISKFMGKE